MTIPLLELSGDPVEMGTHHGASLGSQISDLFEVRLGLLSGPPLRVIRRSCERLWDEFQARLPELSIEVAETGRAAGLSTWQMIVAGGYTDVADVVGGYVESGSECSIATNSPQRILYGTWDSHREAADAAVIVRRRPERGLATLALTSAGWPVQFGLNERGLGFAITNLVPVNFSDTGLVFIAAIAQVSQCSEVAEAARWLGDTRLASGHSYLMVDSSETQVIETDASGISVRSDRLAAVETNHYQTPRDDNSRYPQLAGSVRRSEELGEAVGAIKTPADFTSWLGETRFVLRRDPAAAAVTCAYFFIDVQAGHLFVGRPGQDAQRFSLT